MTKKKTRYAILGAGNGGQAVAGHLSLSGYSVRLYDYSDEQIDKLRKRGRITLVEDGNTNEAYPEMFTANIKEAVEGADVVMIVNPAIYHGQLAAACAPHLKDNQIVFLHPGSTFGALDFKQKLEENGCKRLVSIAESNTLIFACRAMEAGLVQLCGKKDRLLVATVPAADNLRVVGVLKEAFPEIDGASNVMITSFDNTNPIFHPAPTLLSTAFIESGQDFKYYHQGISESIGRFITAMDQERLAVGAALGLDRASELNDIFRQYLAEYAAAGDTITEVVRNVKAYADISGPASLKTRYLYEDIPMGLVPLVSLGKQLGVGVDKMELVIRLAEQLTGEDFTTCGRTMKNLRMEGMTASEIMAYAITGIKKYVREKGV